MSEQQQPVCIVCGQPATVRLCDDERLSLWRWYCRTHGSNWILQPRLVARQQATEDALALVRRLVHVRPWLHHSGTLFTEPWWSCVLCGGISPDMAGHESVIHQEPCPWVEAHRIIAALGGNAAQTHVEASGRDDSSE